jgi:predicted NAD-dependent protein-ADP-ribosyltransferase YbiA (DUF1768 family)
MMYQKAMLMKDEASAKKILACGKPANAKKLGQSVAPWNEKLWLAEVCVVLCCVVLCVLLCLLSVHV